MKRISLCSLVVGLVFVSAVVLQTSRADDSAPGDDVVRSEAECKALGFESQTVKCKHCALLLFHTNEPSLYDECKSCCKEQDTESLDDAQQLNVKYKKARLELDFRGLYPGSEMSRFVEEHASAFRNLAVVEVPRMSPRLVLLGDDGLAAETVRVQSWRSGLIVDYLKNKLESS